MRGMHTPTPHTLEDRVALVVGASGGLGKAVAELLAQERSRVFALARTVERVDFPGGVVKIPMNIRDVESIDKAFGEIDRQTRRVDILVNCAGRGLVKPFQDTTREEIMDVFGTNLKGNIYTALEAYKRMLPNTSGHIVNVASTTGVVPKPKETIYAASKAGLRAFTEALRMEAAPHGIRVTGISPGGMDTGFWEREGMPPAGEEFMDPADVAEQIMNLLRSPSSISPAELVIQRGVVKSAPEFPSTDSRPARTAP